MSDYVAMSGIYAKYFTRVYPARTAIGVGPYGCFTARTSEKTSELYQKLQEEHVVVAKREGKSRVSPHLFNSERDIDRLINVVAA